MADKPILIIQMQRLGDLVLTYPLMGWLSRLYPNNPVWVVGEEIFYSELMELSPDAVYFPYSAAPALQKQKFRTVINLSHRPEALDLAGALETDERIGTYRSRPTGRTFINGDWQLYRASLVNNNRYNLFHWADMNVLDTVPPKRLLTTLWPMPEQKPATNSAHIGLFLGASETDKHPDAPFWIELAQKLLQGGHRPVLLGGEAEKPLGAVVAKGLGGNSLNLTGRFSISALGRFIKELDLFVTPDTGPMHIAAWTGTPTLNISTGPVNAWETGPFSPGHYVLRAALPCIGCWYCTHTSVLCKERLNAKRTAFLIHELVAKKNGNLQRITLPGQELLITNRDAQNLFELKLVSGEEQPRQVMALFWRAFFGHMLGALPEEQLISAWQTFAAASPGNAPAFAKSLIKLSRDFSLHLRGAHTSPVTSANFWSSFPLPLRPLTSYLHMKLQNGLFAQPAFREALALVERLSNLQR